MTHTCLISDPVNVCVQLRARLSSLWSRGLLLCARGSLSALGAKQAAMQWSQWSGEELITNHCKVRGVQAG